MGCFSIGVRLIAVTASILLQIHGELVLQLPPRPARVYKSAPSGLLVTEVRVVETQQLQDEHTVIANHPRYYLHEGALNDNKYFTIGENTGKVTTNRYIDKDEGEMYRVIIVAFLNGLAINSFLNITVTQYNNKAPKMDQQMYSAEVLEKTVGSTMLLKVNANDADVNSLNREIYYYLSSDEATLAQDSNTKEVFGGEIKNPFLYTDWSPLEINTSNGEVSVKQPFNVSLSPLRLIVGAVDGGSPQRQHHVPLTIYIRDISAPLTVEILNTTESMMTVCWMPPKYGVPQGYTLTYTPMPHGSTGVLNLTLDDLTISENPAQNTSRQNTFTTKDAPIEKYCAKIGGLQNWIEYVVRVRAWAGIRVSMGAEPITATTRTNFCAAGVCGSQGNCTLQQDSPGYICHCKKGYYGNHCEAHNPCLTGTPCSGYGTCLNTTNSEFTCECFSGFYGKDCSRFDPCQAISTNPCNNGGICRSEESGSYNCQCQTGFWGSTCEHWDPCSSTPCQNMATCTNITDTEYTCTCASGYTGFDCQLDIDECSTHQCQNGATCIDHVAHYVCSCASGYTGVHCEEDIDECKVKPCVHGLCVDHLANFECQCDQGWGGKTCNIDLESCPAQITSTDIGNIIWPPTKHGKEVIVKCPYGVTSTTQTLLQVTVFNSVLTTTYLPTTTSNLILTKTVASSPTETIPMTRMTSSLQHEDINIPEIVSSAIPLDIATQPERKGNSFTIERRYQRDLSRDMQMKKERNMNNHKGDRNVRATPALKQANRHRQSARHHLIKSHMRGTKSGLHSQIHQQRRRLSEQTLMQKAISQTNYRKSIVNKGFYGNESNIQHRRSSRFGELELILKEGSRKGEKSELRMGEQGINTSKTGKTLIRETRMKEPIIREPKIRNLRKREHRIGETRIEEAREKQTDETKIAEAQKYEVQIQNPRIGDSKIQETTITDESYVDDPIILNTEKFNPKVDPRDMHQHMSDKKQDTNNSKRTTKGSSKIVKDIPNIIEINRYGLRSDNNNIHPVFGDINRQVQEEDVSSVVKNKQTRLNFEAREDIEENNNPSYKKNMWTESYNINEVTESILVGGARSCVLLPNGTITWEEPDTTKCRVKETQEAEERTKQLADMTSTPRSVNVDVFTNTTKQLADLVNLALNDTRVAINLVDVISNMMDVNDSVVTAGEVENNTSQSIVNTINTFAEKIKVDPGNKVTLHSSNLVVEVRVLSPAYGKLKAMFRPYQEQPHESNTETTFKIRNQREAEHFTPKGPTEPYLVVPPEALSQAEEENVRLQFVSYSNDKFFRGSRPLHMPVITASIRSTNVVNLTEKIQYYIPIQHLQERHLQNDSLEHEHYFIPICVYWDETVKDWSSNGVETMVHENITSCASSHLTAFSVLLEPIPLPLGRHETALSAITYFGLTLSTIGLAVTVATYALFRTLNRDRSGKIVMNLSLALLLLNVVFLITTTGVKPTSAVCTALAATLHYLVLAAFAWMLVEAANMYQLLITVFASQEMYFMAKRIAGAWGLPLLLVAGGLIADHRIYGDEDRGICVITSTLNPTVYYTTYMGPICVVLVINCVVFVLVTRVLCQRRPHKTKSHSGPNSSSKKPPVTLAQVRGAITVVALLGVTWVSGAVSIGWARIPLLYIMCITTPIQGLIIFIVRVAQHSEARSSWLTLLTTGTLRRRPQPTHTHSSNHTSSAGHTPPRNTLSSTLTSSIRISSSFKGKESVHSLQKNGSNKSYKRNDSTVRKRSTNDISSSEEKNSIFGKIMNRFSNQRTNSGIGKDIEEHTSKRKSTLSVSASSPGTLPDHDYFHKETFQQDSFFRDNLLKDFNYNGNPKGFTRRPKSLILLRSDNHGSVSACQPTSLRKSMDSEFFKENTSHSLHFPPISKPTVSSSVIPRRTSGSVLLLAEGKEGDDSSWHFVYPPSNDCYNPVSLKDTSHSKNIKNENNDRQSVFLKCSHRHEPGDKCSTGCLVTAGQNVAVDMLTTPILTHASSDQDVAAKDSSWPTNLQRAASDYTTGK